MFIKRLLAFPPKLCYHRTMLNDPPPLETAEQRAQRYWRNKAINLETKQPTIIDQHHPPIINNLETLHSFKHDIRKIMMERPTQMLSQYLISIKAKKLRLMRERLKRLERRNDSEL